MCWLADGFAIEFRCRPVHGLGCDRITQASRDVQTQLSQMNCVNRDRKDEWYHSLQRDATYIREVARDSARSEMRAGIRSCSSHLSDQFVSVSGHDHFLE